MRPFTENSQAAWEEFSTCCPERRGASWRTWTEASWLPSRHRSRAATSRRRPTTGATCTSSRRLHNAVAPLHNQPNHVVVKRLDDALRSTSDWDRLVHAIRHEDQNATPMPAAIRWLRLFGARVRVQAATATAGRTPRAPWRPSTSSSRGSSSASAPTAWATASASSSCSTCSPSASTATPTNAPLPRSSACISKATPDAPCCTSAPRRPRRAVAVRVERWSAVQRAASSGHQQPRKRTKQRENRNRQRPRRKDTGNHQPDDEHTHALPDPLVPTVPDDRQGRSPAFLTPNGNHAPQHATTTTAPAPRWRVIAALSTRPRDRHRRPRGGSSCGGGSIAWSLTSQACPALLARSQVHFFADSLYPGESSRKRRARPGTCARRRSSWCECPSWPRYCITASGCARTRSATPHRYAGGRGSGSWGLAVRTRACRTGCAGRVGVVKMNEGARCRRGRGPPGTPPGRRGRRGGGASARRASWPGR